jgi:alpha-L-fucosidase 2
MKFLFSTCFAFCSLFTFAQTNEMLLYQQPAANWDEALPVGNGRLGAMVFGKTDIERVQLNDKSLWAGSKIDDNNPKAAAHLREIQQLLIDGENEKATQLGREILLSVPLRFRSYQTLGDLYLDFGSQRGIKITDYKTCKISRHRPLQLMIPKYNN